MKLLLTGLPKSGKSTMLVNAITDVVPKQGFTSPEVKENGERIGFDLRNEQGDTAPLSRIKSVTDYPVGRYYVDLKSLENFIDPLFVYDSEQLLFIDEIGQMQLYSERFKDLVEDYLQAPNDFIGTVSQVYNHAFIRDLKKRNDILLCTVKPESRTQLSIAIHEALNSRGLLNLLPQVQQYKVLSLARNYLANDQYTSLKKLFKNAVLYVATKKIAKSDDGFIVTGMTNEHHVRHSDDKYICDCDFFNGHGQFINDADECSHIQSIEILLS
jgi:nucleoside-triphosphatase